MSQTSSLLDERPTAGFAPLNRAYDSVFRQGRLSVGLVVPIERYDTSAVPTMERHLERAQLAEALGFKALWLRDVPFNVPSFGDAGQTFDPFVYLGLLAGATKEIALGTASIILPLRHPAHVAKAAASADVLSGGRILLGVASGDRPDEYPALNMTFPDRGARFRESIEYINALGDDYPTIANGRGRLTGAIDMLPKPTGARLPLLITGGSQQSPEWIASHGDGWMTYPRSIPAQANVIKDYRSRIAAAGVPGKPVMQSLYVDLVADPDAAASPIHLGFRSGSRFLLAHLAALRDAGVNHVALNLRFNGENTERTLEHLAAAILPAFHS
ncbi:MAG: LLM class oxidoreductase [Pseudomonadota bacterium]